MEFGSSVTGCDNQKKKPHKKQKANECEDIISNLPESLISRILSFLPTEDAVCTSVLSKRWINRWTTINKLVLDEYLFYSHKRRRGTGRNQHFVNFVNRALLLTKGSTMESIHLDINDSEFDESLLNTWLSSIFNGSVKHLNICLNVKISFSPLTLHSLFNSMSLEELVLEMSWCNIKVPTTNVYFGYLKSLVFTGIDFTVDSSGDHLSLSLPVLKKFKTGDCAWINAKNIVVEAPLLEIIYIDQDLLWPSEPRGSAITFSTLHLKELTYLGNDTSRTVILSDPSSAYNASAHISLYQSGDVFPELVSNAFLLLKQFSHMKCIEFDGAEVLTQPELAILPVFAMLRHLVLGSITGEVLLGLLQRSPVLKTLVLNKGISKVDQDLFNSAVVPHCLASTLRVVKFGSFNRDEHELCLAKYFMENCVVLEKMSFSRFRP